MNILYASNNKFISIMLTSIVSLLENTEQKISLYIIDDDISEKNKNIIKILNLEKLTMLAQDIYKY